MQNYERNNISAPVVPVNQEIPLISNPTSMVTETGPIVYYAEEIFGAFDSDD